MSKKEDSQFKMTWWMQPDMEKGMPMLVCPKCRFSFFPTGDEHWNLKTKNTYTIPCKNPDQLRCIGVIRAKV